MDQQYGAPNGLVVFLAGVVVLSIFIGVVWGIPALMDRRKRRRVSSAGALSVDTYIPPAPTSRPAPSVAQRIADMPDQPIVNAAWIEDVQRALHLLVIGHSGGGKTTLIHELATEQATKDYRVIVCDPDAAPGLWFGCRVYGNGNDFNAITKALTTIKAEVTKRRALRGEGVQRSFEPIYLVIDEYQDVVQSCPDARPLVEDILRRGRKLGIHLFIGVQDKAVKTMNFEGQGDLRRNFTWIIEVKQANDGRRIATLTNPNDDDHALTYVVPQLPDLDKLVESAAPGGRAARVDRYGLLRDLLDDDVSFPQTGLATEHTAFSRQSTPVQTSLDQSENMADIAVESPRPQSRPESESAGPVQTSATDETSEAIRVLLAAGWSKNRIASFVSPTSKGKGYDLIKKALGEE